MTGSFGTMAWIYYIAQTLLIGAGMLLRFARIDPIPVRKKLFDAIGGWMILLGVIGAFFGLMRLFLDRVAIPNFWFGLVLLAELVIGGYLLRLYREAMPAVQQAVARGPARKSVRAQPVLGTQATASGPELGSPRGTSPRRASRREKKRRS